MADARRGPEATIHDLPHDVIAQIERTGPCEVVIGVATYNNAATIAGVADAARAAVDKHFRGVPGRGEALRTILGVAHRLGARVLVLLEADVTTITDEWPERLARPILGE